MIRVTGSGLCLDGEKKVSRDHRAGFVLSVVGNREKTDIADRAALQYVSSDTVWQLSCANREQGLVWIKC